MKTVTNHKTIKNRKKIGQYTTITSLLVLAGGLYMSFKPELINYSFAALIVGFLLSQMGIYYGGRWGRSPRPDEIITGSLKGLENKFTLYHYVSPVHHLLIGPAGLWILIPYHQGGAISYDTKRNRWKQKGGNLYLKIFAQESLGHPENDIENQKKSLVRWLEKNFESQNELPPINVALVFTNPKADVQADDAPVPTLPIGKLKDFMRRAGKQDVIPADITNPIKEALPKADIEAV